jgi:hypothetical protein
MSNLQPFETSIGGPVYLYNAQCGGNLKVNHPGMRLDGRGKWGKWAKFMVRPTNHGPGVIRLSPWTNGKTHVKIPKNGNPANALGGLGKQSLLRVQKTGNMLGVISLASAHFNTNAHVGVLPNGQMKPVFKTGVGAAGQFRVVSGWLAPGSRVHLSPVSCHGNLAYGKNTGTVHQCGGNGKWAKWIVRCPDPNNPQIVMLQHFVFKGKYLALSKFGKACLGGGGKWCKFHARPAGKHKVCFRPLIFPGKRGLGFAPHSSKWGKRNIAPHKVGLGKFGQFRITHW